MTDGRMESVELAKLILVRANDRKININMTKLQKLLYICDGLMLACDRNIVNENARAWDYGPVYPKVYTWFNKHGLSPVSESDIAADDHDFMVANDISYVVDTALNHFGSWSASELSEWSHKDGSPWSIALKKNDGAMGSTIDKLDMTAFFKGLVNG